MAKTNAEKQREYRERKKLESKNFLEKERKRPRKYYIKTSQLTKKKLKQRRIAVKKGVQNSRQKTKMLLENMNESCSSSDTDGTISPLVVSMNFPKRGESPRKRKRQTNDKLYHKIAKLKEDKRRPERKCDSLRKKVHRKIMSASPLTPKTKVKKMMKAAGIKPVDAPEIQKQLLFAEAISSEIQQAGKERKNKKESIRTLLSGKVLKKYRLLRYAARKTCTNRRKLYKVSGKIINCVKPKRGFKPVLHAKFFDFYHRDDVSAALPGKRDAKKHKMKKIRIQKRVLNDYLSNLYEKFLTENTDLKCPFATFARMRPSYFVLANFSNRKTCLCTYHQNFALILKMLKKHINIPTRPETFIKFTDEQILSKSKGIKINQFSFDVWKKVPVAYKGKNTKKMKIVTETLNRSEFLKRIIDDVHNFRSHVFHISCQFKGQRNLKENLPSNHTYIHMDFAKDYKCRSQNEVQSAYWGQTQVTIHPVLMYYKKNEKLEHKSYVFISNESRHDAVFVYTLIQKLIPLLK